MDPDDRTARQVASASEGGVSTVGATLSHPSSEPSTVSVASLDTGEGTVEPSSLTFTTGNWNTAQRSKSSRSTNGTRRAAVSEANARIGHHQETIGQLFGVSLQEMPDCPDLIRCSFILEPKQENAPMGAPFSKHLLPEVLVGRDQYPLLVICLAKDVGILRSSRRFIHREDLVPFLSQPMRNGGTNTLVQGVDLKLTLRSLRN